MLSADKSRGVNFSSLWCSPRARSPSDHRRSSIAPFGLSYTSLVLMYVRTVYLHCVHKRVSSSSFHKACESFHRWKASRRPRWPSEYRRRWSVRCAQWVTKIRAVFKWAFTSFKVVALLSKVGWERRRECDRTAAVIEKMIRAIVSLDRKSSSPLADG